MYKEVDQIFEEISRFLTEDVPFVVYRKPNGKKLRLIVQKNSKLHLLSSFDESGFVFAPFSKTENKILFPENSAHFFYAELPIIPVDNTDLAKPKRFMEIDMKLLRERHEQLVKNGIKCIQESDVEKMVLSRVECIQSDALNPLGSLKRMLGKYKNAFVYLWSHPKVGTWMGASPERLIQSNGRTLKTMALAGTQSYLGNEEVSWSEKDRMEQQFVTDDIVRRIKEIAESIVVQGPKTVMAGNLLHLKTTINAEMKSDRFLAELIDRIHPTPAVCGVPRDKATSFILENENYDRSFYAGYLGEINLENSNSLFVNLRCMNIEEKTANLFIGGGITKDSDPLKEWEETVAKAEIMKSIL